MSPDPTTARTMIDAWREQRADRLNPMRFRFIDALERRAAGQAGELRRVLDERLASLLTAYAGDLAKVPVSAKIPCEATSRPLGELLDHLATETSTRGGDAAVFDPTPGSTARPVLPALEEFRETWSTVRSDSRLRKSLAFVPTNAGPLNSAALVHRSMALMRELSPEYLRHFLGYVDDLSWLEQLEVSVGGNPAARSISTKKRARKKFPT